MNLLHTNLHDRSTSTASAHRQTAMVTTSADRSSRRRRIRLAGAATAAALLIAACGGADGDASPIGDSLGGDVATDVATAGGDANLSTAPIPFRDLYDGRTADEPVARTETVQLDACPLLSLDSLNASSGTYTNPTVLSEATARRCSFSNGPAFSFSVQIESAADVDVDDHSGRAYNIDIEPIVEPQSGPGEKAVMLIDTAFSDGNPDDGLRYLYFFVQGDHAVTLRSTAFKIRDNGWRALADEVAAHLQSGAAGGEVETVEVIDEVEPYTIEICGFVEEAQLEALAGVDAGSVVANHAESRFTCSWSHPDLGSLNFDFRAQQFNYADAANGGEDRRGELGIMAVGSNVLYDVWLQPDSVWGFMVNVDSEGWYATADAVAVNLAPRIVDIPVL